MRKFYGNYFQIRLDEFISVLKDLYKSYATSTPESSKTKGAVSANELVSPTDHESQEQIMRVKMVNLRVSYMMIVGLIEMK